MALKCSHCGRLSADDKRNCTYCGQPLDLSQLYNQIPDEDDEQPQGSLFDSVFSAFFGGSSFSRVINLNDLFGTDSLYEDDDDDDYEYQVQSSSTNNMLSQKIQYIIGDDDELIDPDSLRYEAHKMRMVIELEDEMVVSGMNERQRQEVYNDRLEFCKKYSLCPNCYEKVFETKDGLCQYCGQSVDK